MYLYTYIRLSLSLSLSLLGLGLTTALVSPKQQLVKAGMATPNPSHLISLSNYLGLPLVSAQPIRVDDSCIR